MNGTDGFLDIHDSNLRVLDGNIHAKSIVLDQLDITSSNTTTSTVQFLNTNKAFKTTANIEVGNANLFVDTSTSNVGILTSTPTHTLDVRGTANVEVLRTTSNIEMNGGTFSLGGHMIPTTHEQYDIGTAERKIRHLFLSDNSLWIGDKAKISYDNTGDKLTFHKRKASDTFIPAKIIQLANASGQGLDTTIAIQNHILGKEYTPGNLGAMKLHHWLQYAKEFQSNIDLSDIFTSTESDYDSMSTAEGLENVPGASNGELYTTRKVRIGSSVAPTANLDIEGTLKVSGFVGTSETGALSLPSGTTAQKPTGVAGMIRFNTELSELEYYTPLESSSPAVTGGTITSITGGETSTDTQVRYKIHEFTSGNVNLTVSTGPVLIEYLIIGGGGGGGVNHGGGGGGGGYITGTMKLLAGTYPIVIGAGGNGGTYINNTYTHPTNGGNSSAFGLTAYGGGAGGNRDGTYATDASTATLGIHGASGGGGAGTGYAQADTTTRGGMNKIYPNEWKPVINDHSIQGNAGGYGSSGPASAYNAGNGGGGGGAGGGGQNATGQSSGAGKPGDGGVGKFSGITGNWIERAGGGGGGRWSSGTGSSASGGGGVGGNNDSVVGTAGTSGTGGGGGGGGGNSAAGGNGGSGIVIVRYKV